jgi:TRAP transporter 4TM/12TM fusion protein
MKQNWSRILGSICFVVALVMSVFQLYTAGFGVYPPMIQRSLHLAFGLFLAFLLYPLIGRRSNSTLFKTIDLVIAVLAVSACLHLTVTWETIIARMGRPTTMDTICGAILIIVLIDMGRRTIGWPLPLISIAALLYSYFGPYMPGMLCHRGNTIPQIISYMYMTTEGIFGIPLAISATVVYAFIIFGTFMMESGTGDFITDVAYAVAGRARGGPAKIAIFSSGFFGMLSGSVVANVATTGSFTIPLMKRVGFQPHFAGAVEAAASTGGQIMPPVMGAAAFIMAEMTGISYIQICIAAAIPAFLYFLSVFFMIHFRAVKRNISGLSKEDLPKIKDVLKAKGHLIIPPLFLVYLLIVVRYSPMKSAFLSMPILLIVSTFRRNSRMSISKIMNAMKDAAFTSAPIIAACALAGIVIAVATQTGLGLKFSNMLITLAQSQLVPTLILVMITSIILGTGVTTSAAYIIASLLGASALENLGVPTMATHLFILYFGVLSFITPPVAIGAYAAAGIAGANPFTTALSASRIGLAGFIIPYMFVYGPSLLMIGSTLEIVVTTGTAIVGIVALAASLEGYLVARCNVWERVILFVIALMLIKPGILTDLGGVAGFLFILSRQGKFMNLLQKRYARHGGGHNLF